MTPQVDTGTDLEDELSIPASPPADVNHEVVPLAMRADVDSELGQVFGDVGSLPTMVTPVCDLDGGMRVTQAECPVIEPPGVSAFVTPRQGRNFCLRDFLIHRRSPWVSCQCLGRLR